MYGPLRADTVPATAVGAPTGWYQSGAVRSAAGGIVAPVTMSTAARASTRPQPVYRSHPTAYAYGPPTRSSALIRRIWVTSSEESCRPSALARATTSAATPAAPGVAPEVPEIVP